jgi:hypothetical protein
MRGYKIQDMYIRFDDNNRDRLIVLTARRLYNHFICEGDPVLRCFTVSNGTDSGKKVLWQYAFTNTKLSVKDSYSDNNNNRLQTFEVGREGSGPETSVYWAAYLNDCPIDLNYRLTLFRDEDHTYSNWVNRLKNKYLN